VKHISEAKNEDQEDEEKKSDVENNLRTANYVRGCEEKSKDVIALTEDP
jgi:hypothetical protein